MDLLIAKRGSMLRTGGEIATSADRKVLLSQYMRSAILDSVKIEDIPINREFEVRDRSQFSIRQQQIQSYVIDTIMASPYGSDFIRSNFSVIVSNTSPDGLTLQIQYKDPVDDNLITEDFSLKGGLIDLPLNPSPGYEPVFKTQICHEDLIVEEATDVLSTASLVDGFCAVCVEGTVPRDLLINVDISTIPDSERKRVEVTQTIRGIDDNGIAFAEPHTAILGVNTDDPRFTSNSLANNPGIFLRSLLPGLTSADAIVGVTDLKGNAPSIQYIPQAEDFLVFVDPNDLVVSLRCSIVTAIAKGVQSKVEDVINYAERAMYPFESDWVRSPRLVFLDAALEPGVYSLYYQAKVPVQYDASMETT